MMGQQSGHMRPPPNKPTSYREYRRLKEEAEKRRREFEDKIRKEEEAKRKAEEKARLDAEELSKKSREAMEESEPEPMEIEIEESKPEQVEVVETKAPEPLKKRESKDPRRRKVEEKERKDSLKKTIEPVKETPKSSNEPIKAFKIPKVKKIDKPEATPSKTVEADLSKGPDSKSKDVTTPKEVTKKDSALKEVIKKDSAIKVVLNVDTEDPHHSHGETDSDSEPSLTIAEDHEESARRRSSASESDSEVKSDPKAKVVPKDSEPKKRRISVEKDKDSKRRISEEKDSKNCDNSDTRIENVKEAEANTSVEEGGAITKNELTKELLKSIVSSLDPKEASKLLQKAASMKKDDKITIETLTELIETKDSPADQEETVDNEDPEDEPLSKKRKRGRPKTPVKDKKTKDNEDRAARRRKRNREETQESDNEVPAAVPEAVVQEVEESLEKVEADAEADAKDHDETETFVIEPKAVAKRGRKKRGRKAAKPAIVELDDSTEDLQDDSISSSNIEESTVEPKEESPDVKEESEEQIPEVKVEIEEPVVRRQSEDDSNVVKQENVRQTRGMKSRMVKTKTWKPSNEICSPETELTKLSCLKSPPLKENQVGVIVFIRSSPVIGQLSPISFF